jgi:streptogramin lyase
MGIAVDSNGTILVADAGAWDVSGDGKIIGINPSTKEQWVISSDVYLDDPYGIALEASGNILVTDGRAGPAEVLRIDRASGNQSVVSTGGELINPDDIAVGPDGWIYLADAGDGAGYGGIIKINPFTGEQSYVEPRGIHDAVSGIAVDGTGRIYFPDDDPSEIWTILPPEESELVSSGDYLDTGVRHIDLDLNGNVTVTDFTGNGSGGELLQINPTTGEQRQIMTWDGDPAWGIAVYPFPEPATLSLLAFGGLAVMRRRRRSTVR